MKKVLVIGFLVLATIIPLTTLAVWTPGDPLVPSCYLDDKNATSIGPYCQLCDLLDLANNLITFAIYFATMVATAMFVYAGILYVTSAADTGRIEKAKKIFWNVFWGLVIVISAWLVINVVLSVLTGSGVTGWTEKASACTKFARVSNTAPGATVTSETKGSTGSTIVSCTNCENITSFQCKEGINCTAARPLNEKLAQMCAALGSACDDIQVTEGWPPQYAGHSYASQHNNGTAVDMNCLGGCSVAQIKSFLQQASSAGLKATYETTSLALRNALVASGVPESSVRYNSDASADHFHLADRDG